MRGTPEPKEKILEELTELYYKGVLPIRKELIDAGHREIILAITREQRRSPHKRYFTGMKDVRKALGRYILDERGDKEAAQEIFRLNRKTPKKWTKTSIVKALAKLHEQGVKLIGEQIQEYNSQLHNAIYYRTMRNGRTAKTSNFPSLNDAREAVATYFTRQGNEKAARAILKLNEPQVSPTKKSEQEREAIKKQLITTLKEKVEVGEDLGHRAQQKTDRSFVNACNRYFGSYRAAFGYAGIDFKQHANRTLNKDKQEYFQSFLNIIRVTTDLKRATMEKEHKKLIERINHYFTGYHNALTLARNYFEKRGEEEQANKIDTFYTGKTTFREIHKEEQAEWRENQREKVSDILVEKTYSPQEISFVKLKTKKTGRELLRMLKESDAWLLTRELAPIIATEPSNIIKNMLQYYPERSVRFITNNNFTYVFHQSIIKEEFEKGKVYNRVIWQQLHAISNSKDERDYFRSIILPRLERFVEDKTTLTPDEIKEQFYECAGTRVVENYLRINGPEDVLSHPATKELLHDLFKGEATGVYKRLEHILEENTSKEKQSL